MLTSVLMSIPTLTLASVVATRPILTLILELISDSRRILMRILMTILTLNLILILALTSLMVLVKLLLT